ncbi:MAG: Smr/MutS family protein [Caulobacteraceae bacterium]
MKSGPDIEDLRLWAVVAATVRPLRPSPQPLPDVAESAPNVRQTRPNVRQTRHNTHTPPAPSRRAAAPPADVDAALHRRLTRGGEALAARIDLHGLTQDEARAALTRFIARSAGEGWRAVLVITGKGVAGDGVLRRRAPEWLAAPPIREHVAGVSEAHRRHGGEGALYVALKRRR